MKDIIIYLSDQHRSDAIAYRGNPILETPNLDKLGKEGVTFSNASTSCPLCVPARMSLLTSLMPTTTGIMDNDQTLLEEQVTFLHELVLKGYETVLCGRMHYKGFNQFHGFSKRIAGDITPQFWGNEGPGRDDLGMFKGTLGVPGCLNVVGGGNSPVLAYDEYVIKAALGYLSEDHDKPQCIVIGTYAPHFSYVAPKFLYEKYLDLLNKQDVLKPNPTRIKEYDHLEKKFDIETMIKSKAAYYGMIENMDRQIGLVRDRYNEYLMRNNKEGIFIYMSDHGDHVGERKIYGKKSFLDQSVKIPLIFSGDGIQRNIVKHGDVSIIDINPTILEIAGAEPLLEKEGKSLVEQLYGEFDDLNRVVKSEMLYKSDDRVFLGEMYKNQNNKTIKFSSGATYYLENDIVAQRSNDVTVNFKEDHEVDTLLERYVYMSKNIDIVKKYGRILKRKEKYRFELPESAKIL